MYQIKFLPPTPSYQISINFQTHPPPLPCNFIKKETLAQVFSCGFCKISKNTFFTDHLWTTASLKITFYTFSQCPYFHFKLDCQKMQKKGMTRDDQWNQSQYRQEMSRPRKRGEMNIKNKHIQDVFSNIKRSFTLKVLTFDDI